MKQRERRQFLIRALIAEQPRYRGIEIPENADEQKMLLRSLMNVRMPGKINEDFLAIQDEYLQEAAKEKGITDIAELEPAEEGIFLWQGDITTLRCDAIVNAANSGMPGCFPSPLLLLQEERLLCRWVSRYKTSRKARSFPCLFTQRERANQNHSGLESCQAQWNRYLAG